MSTFAIIDGNNFVTQVQRITQDVIDTGAFGDPASFVQTSFNTLGGVHYGEDGQPSADQSKALRKNYAGIGYKYDSVRDAFIQPKRYASWVLNEASCLWESPVPYPTDGKRYVWDEPAQVWLELANV